VKIENGLSGNEHGKAGEREESRAGKIERMDTIKALHMYGDIMEMHKFAQLVQLNN
jgi:hypothetical protein